MECLAKGESVEVHKWTYVLILVLMECLAKTEEVVLQWSPELCLNPCFGGMSCEDCDILHHFDGSSVLILVLMECLAKLLCVGGIGMLSK